jgi:hypothetical protein
MNDDERNSLMRAPDLRPLSMGLNQFRALRQVRLNVPNSIAPFVLGKVLGPLISAHPNLKPEVLH